MPFPDIIYPGGAAIEPSELGDEIGTDDTATVVFHEEKAASRLIERWKDKAALVAWVRVYAREMQEFESACWDAIVLRFVDYAPGVHLDAIGRIVGAKRNGRADPAMRARVKAQILINQSFGRAPNIIQILRAISGARHEYHEFPNGIAFFAIIFEEPTETLGLTAEIPSIVFDSKAAGVGASVTLPAYDPGLTEHSFRLSWSGGDDADEEGAGLGWVGGGYYGGSLSWYTRD